MGEFLGDLRIGARQLIRRPGFALAAISTLAIGIGLNTTLFTVVNAMLFRKAAVAEPARLVEIYSSAASTSRSSRPRYPISSISGPARRLCPAQPATHSCEESSRLAPGRCSSPGRR